MPRCFRRAALTLALTVGASSALAQTPSPAIRFIVPPVETAAVRATQTQAAAKPTAAAAPSTASGRWWNDPLILADLPLSTETRAAMDKRLEELTATQLERQRRQTEARRRYEAALTRRQWDEAGTAAAEMTKEMSEIWGAQTGFKVDVLRLLTPPQQETLFAKHPYLLQRPWMGGPGITSLHFEGTPRPRAPLGDKPK